MVGEPFVGLTENKPKYEEVAYSGVIRTCFWKIDQSLETTLYLMNYLTAILCHLF